MRTPSTAAPSAGHYRLARGTRLYADHVVCDYPLRILRPGAAVLRLLILCEQENTPAELAMMLRLPLRRVEQLCEQLRWKGWLEAGPAPQPDIWPGVSIIIPSHNRAQQLEHCLQALLQLEYPADKLEIIVVDDCSSDDTGTLIERLSPEFAAQGLALRSIHHAQHRGAAQSRNEGAGAARYDLLAYLDSDCVVTPGWLTALVPAFADPTIIAAGGQIRGLERRSLLGRYEDRKSSLNMGAYPQRVTLEGPLTYLPTANLLVRREALRRIGGFAPLTFGEDVDFCRRLLLDGARILYLPHGTVLHDYRTTLPAFLHTRVSYASAEAVLQQRHPATRRALVLPPEQAAFAGMVIGGIWGLLWGAVRCVGCPCAGHPLPGHPQGVSLHLGVPPTPPGWPPDVRGMGGGVCRDVGTPLVGVRRVGIRGVGIRGVGIRGVGVRRVGIRGVGIRRRGGAISLIAASLLTLSGAHKRHRSARRHGIMLHPLVVLRSTIRSHLAYTYHLCRHITRYYTLPLLIVGIIIPPLLLLLFILCSIVISVDYVRLRPTMRLGQYALCSLLDDCAYEVGVVLGCIKRGTWKPLIPVVRKSWRANDHQE
jgi:mycofactocin system glycosyltransferase